MVYYTIAVKLAFHMIYNYIFGTLKDSCCMINAYITQYKAFLLPLINIH